MSPRLASSATRSSVVSIRHPIVASKKWKDLQRACLDRARAYRGHRRDIAHGTDMPGMLHHPNDLISDLVANDIDRRARSLVDETMRKHGVVLVPNCINLGRDVTRSLISPDEKSNLGEREYDDVDACSTSWISESNAYINEDELFQLLEDVEHEIQRQEALHTEELLDMAEQENLEFQDQIADFEHWEETRSMQEGSILCSICNEALLVATEDGRIVCPNLMDGSCSLEFSKTAVSMSELRERLDGGIRQHSSYCDGRISFETTGDDETEGSTRLLATCEICLMYDNILAFALDV